MPTIGDIVLKSMRETKPGIKGTESETLGDWILGKKKAREEAEKRPWFTWRGGLKWLDPRVHIGTLGEMIFGKKEEKPLVQPWEKTGLGVRGYSQEDIDKGIGGQIRVDMRRILEQPGGAELTSKGMTEALRGLGYSDEAIRNAGVEL